MAVLLRPRVLASVVVLLLVVLFAVKHAGGHDYRLEVLVPSADGAIDGTTVVIGGEPVGTVTRVGVSGNAAKLTLSLDGHRTPLHAGTIARIDWNSVIGRRQVELIPGPSSNPELRSGQMIRSNVERVEISDLLNTLNPETRAKVKDLVANLDAALQGNQRNLQRTILRAGPFVSALGTVLRGVGADQQAIDTLVSRAAVLTRTVSAGDAQTADTVRKISAVVAATARHEAALREALAELPATLQSASRLFGHVPSAVDAAAPLLEKLRPTTDKLPAVARQLRPVLTDLRPTIADLRPTLTSAASLLQETPGLLDTGTQTVPEVGSLLGSLQPAVTFLRPYTPELIGFLDNWGSIFAGKNASGHFGRALVPVSASMLNSNPGVVPPGMTQWRTPLPGQLVDQSWTDANGDSAR